jgi:hypothetical protein
MTIQSLNRQVENPLSGSGGNGQLLQTITALAFAEAMTELCELRDSAGANGQAGSTQNGPCGGEDAEFSGQLYCEVPARRPAPPPAKSSDSQAPVAPTGAELQSILNGDSTNLPAPGEKAPPGMTVADINRLDGGLLGHLGNQNLQGQGTIKELLSKKYGGDVTTDPDAAWRAYRALVAVKNETNTDGTPKPASVIHDGRIDGFTKGGEAPHGSEAGSLQDLLLHDRTPSKLEPDPSPQTGANGGSASGIETIGHKIKDGFKTLGNDIKHVFTGIGHGIEDVGKGIGTGVKDLFTGHIAQAGADVVHGFTSGATDVIKPVTTLVGDTLDNIPVVGKSMGNVVKGVGSGASDMLTGWGNAAEDAAHGNLGDAARDIVQGGQSAFSDVIHPVVDFTSTAIDQTPLGNTALGHAFSDATNFVGDKLTGAYDSLSNALGAPVENAGDTASDLLRGNFSQAARDALSTVESTGNAVATVAPLLIPGVGEVAEGAELAGEGIAAGAEGASGAGSILGDAGDMFKTAYNTAGHINDAYNDINGLISPSGNGNGDS